MLISIKKSVGVGSLIVSPNDEPTKFLYELDYEALIIGLELLLKKELIMSRF